MLTTQDIEQMLTERGAVVDLGQISRDDLGRLNEAARAGRLVKYRGKWQTLIPGVGIGPDKTIFALPEFAAQVPFLKPSPYRECRLCGRTYCTEMATPCEQLDCEMEA